MAFKYPICSFCAILFNQSLYVNSIYFPLSNLTAQAIFAQFARISDLFSWLRVFLAPSKCSFSCHPLPPKTMILVPPYLHSKRVLGSFSYFSSLLPGFNTLIIYVCFTDEKWRLLVDINDTRLFAKDSFWFFVFLKQIRNHEINHYPTGNQLQCKTIVNRIESPDIERLIWSIELCRLFKLDSEFFEATFYSVHPYGKGTLFHLGLAKSSHRQMSSFYKYLFIK